MLGNLLSVSVICCHGNSTAVLKDPLKLSDQLIYNYIDIYIFFHHLSHHKKPFWACLIHGFHTICRNNTLCEVTWTYLIILQQNVENWITPHCFSKHLSIPNTRVSMKNKSCTSLAEGCTIKPSHIYKKCI